MPIGFAAPSGFPIQLIGELAQKAEASGFDSFWLTEGAGNDSITQLAHIATITSTIKLGTAIITTFSRTPVLIAQTALSLQEISNGRFFLGLGTGHKSSVEKGQSQTFSRPVSRMKDYLNIIKTIMSKGEISYAGSVVSVKDFKLTSGMKTDRPPLYIATLGGPMAKLAGSLSDGVLPLMASPIGIEELRKDIKEGAISAGRNPSEIDVGCLIITVIAEDRKAAEAEARRQVARYGSLPFYRKMLRIGGFEEDADNFLSAQRSGETHRLPQLVSDRLLETVTLTGPKRVIRDRIGQFRKAGVTHPIIYTSPVGDPKIALNKALDLFTI